MNEQTDREMLELAAKAAGYKLIGYAVTYHDFYWHGPSWGLIVDGVNGVWNPLEDDGDALWLAVKLDIQVFQDQEEDGPAACAGYWGKPWRRDVSRLFIVETYASSANKGSPYAATRRAIVRAAAEIGMAMK